MIVWLAYNILVKTQKTPCSVYERPEVAFASFINLAPAIRLTVGIRELQIGPGTQQSQRRGLGCLPDTFQIIINLCYLVKLHRIPAMLSCTNAVKLYQSHTTQANPLKGTGQTNLQTPGRQMSSHRPAAA
jgi:hypothetical protein